jgi:hypothetical protein
MSITYLKEMSPLESRIFHTMKFMNYEHQPNVQNK